MKASGNPLLTRRYICRGLPLKEVEASCENDLLVHQFTERTNFNFKYISPNGKLGSLQEESFRDSLLESKGKLSDNAKIISVVSQKMSKFIYIFILV